MSGPEWESNSLRPNLEYAENDDYDLNTERHQPWGLIPFLFVFLLHWMLNPDVSHFVPLLIIFNIPYTSDSSKVTNSN